MGHRPYQYEPMAYEQYDTRSNISLELNASSVSLGKEVPSLFKKPIKQSQSIGEYKTGLPFVRTSVKKSEDKSLLQSPVV